MWWGLGSRGSKTDPQAGGEGTALGRVNPKESSSYLFHLGHSVQIPRTSEEIKPHQDAKWLFHRRSEACLYHTKRTYATILLATRKENNVGYLCCLLCEGTNSDAASET